MCKTNKIRKKYYNERKIYSGRSNTFFFKYSDGRSKIPRAHDLSGVKWLPEAKDVNHVNAATQNMAADVTSVTYTLTSPDAIDTFSF